MTTLGIVLLCWVPVSWFIHAFLHENSHASAARYYGFKTTICPWPSKLDGRWVYAYFTMIRKTGPTLKEQAVIFMMPAVTEMLWVMFFGVCCLLAVSRNAAAFLGTEAIMGGIDLSVWLLSLVRLREGTDGHMWLDAIDPLGQKKTMWRMVGVVAVTTLIVGMVLLGVYRVLPIFQS